MITIAGNGHPSVKSIDFYGVYVEAADSVGGTCTPYSNIGIDIEDASNVLVDGLSGAGCTASELVKIGESVSGYTYNIQLVNVWQIGNYAYTVDNAILGTTQTVTNISNYTYAGNVITEVRRKPTSEK